MGWEVEVVGLRSEVRNSRNEGELKVWWAPCEPNQTESRQGVTGQQRDRLGTSRSKDSHGDDELQRDPMWAGRVGQIVSRSP